MKSCIFWVYLVAAVLWVKPAAAQSLAYLDSLITAGEYIAAMDAGTLTLQQDSTQNPTRLATARAAYLSGKFRVAKSHFHVLEAVPYDTTTVYQHLMKIYDAEQNYPLAVKYALKLKNIFPQQSVYARKIADYHLASAHQIEALNYYLQAYLTDSLDMANVLALGEQLYRTDLNLQADTVISMALVEEGDNLALRGLAARVAMKLKKYPEALEHLLFIETKGAMTPYQFKNAGYAFYMVDSLDKAILYLERSLHNENNPELNFYYLALAHSSKGNKKEAQNYFNRAIESGISDHVKTYYQHLATFEARENKFKKPSACWTCPIKFPKTTRPCFTWAPMPNSITKTNARPSIIINVTSNSARTLTA
ncbi:MAG: hypothetical protein IPN29_18275 [Saprospiraceae bacterium]|nr:hypothetical protein [Saprospiraceae bacterium]